MGQAQSSGASAQRPRPQPRARPASWAPSLMGNRLPPDHHGLPELLQRVQNASGTGTSSTPPSRNPFNRLSSHFSRADAGPSTPQPEHAPRTRSRLTRARSSLGSITGLLHRRSTVSARTPEPTYNLASFATDRATLPHSALRHTTSDRGPVLPRTHIPTPDLGIDFDQLLRSHSSPDRADGQRPRPLVPLSSLRRDGRALSMIPTQRRLRNMIGPSRRRRSLWHDEDHLENIERLRRGEDQADVLSRLLSLAAAATAASLVGEDHQAATRDGTFDTFLQSLQNGSIASALRATRVEKVVSQQEGPRPHSTSSECSGLELPLTAEEVDEEAAGSSSGNTGHDGDEDGEGRMVPIIIVGIRSITPGATTGQDDGNIPPFLDALSSFPTPPTSPGDTPDVLRPPQNGTRFSHRRRASMGGFNFPSNYDSQRHHRPHPQDRPRPWSSLTDSPPGPLPPPSTPATNLGLSAEPSGTTTPATSTSPSSPTLQSTVPSRRESFVRRPTASILEPTVEEPQTRHRNARPRRLSESDFTRYGAGAPRRRGVVEPDNNPGEGSRSWIIYVLGGSYPENHPILTTPSLFTDSPTYEDMMLLSSILGPAKPPVASEEDVASAPGLFRIRNIAGVLVAEAVDGDETIDLVADARCLVCLCDFEADEEARKLVKCEHLFHKICIDQWLTTGRNSCPLCRGEGVHETSIDDGEPPDFAEASSAHAAA